MERKPVFNCRTSQMSDEMYNYVEKRLKQMPDKSFRSYAFELIERDMNEDKDKKTMYDLMKEMKAQMEREFKELSKKIDQKIFAVANEQQAIQFQEKQDIKEGDLATEEVTGSIDEEYDIDF
ncbi:hypothetical protein ACPOM7_17435 [Peribacillus castrilensis]|uniref:hypothetical protein n=1 Tax=Bacillaceae TaxID=186817 RepID=UPI0006609B22|nr:MULTISPECIES: hypothetical protein [Bacillaceae]MCT1390120.1 hypothetical protein [Peribacillus frigoritolerans]NCT39993.1 hypothetical protein [Peribacillus frigoritolerans]PRA81600.1 hypothetical protein CQ056_20590 [Peribacillus simplex]